MNYLAKFVTGLLVCLTVSLVYAQGDEGNAIREVRTQLTGDRFFVSLEFDKELKELPEGWATKEPSRVVFDFPRVKNATGQSIYKLNTAGVRSIQLVQTEQQTRAVLSLLAPSGYTTEIRGKTLVIALAPFKQEMDTKQMPVKLGSSAAKIDTPANSVRDLVFRRAESGNAIITVDLSDASVPLDIRRTSTGVVVDLQDTDIPERLLNKRDVNDFATPVTHVTTTVRGKQARIEIGTKGAWQHFAQVTNGQLKVEVRALSASELNKLVPHGQEGKRISINFYDADLGMVLRTLAELSGRNVIVDPSLNGRKITVTLDNMPYDQAIDLVLGQSNAGMRLRTDLVIFGSRDVLMKRDVDLADELARANDTAPLITETFQLNYISAIEIEKLIRLAQNDQTTNILTPVQTSTPSGGAGGQASSSTALQLKGIMTNRGVLSIHGTTNKLFLRDTQAVVDQVRELIREVDVPAKQVLVEARIVEVATDFTQNLGVRLNLFNRKSMLGTGDNIAGGLVDTSQFRGVDLFGGSQTPSLINSASATSKVAGAGYGLAGSSTLNFMLFNSAATRLLQVEIAAAEFDSRGKTISSPRVVTQNRKPAKIENVQATTLNIGIDRTTGIPIFQTYTAPLTLDVTPSVTPDNRIDLQLKVVKATLKGNSSGGIDTETNNLVTNVLVDNGGTVVIGGFYRETDSESTDRVPFLADLPAIGFLFKATDKRRFKSELLVFITPRVVNEALSLR